MKNIVLLGTPQSGKSIFARMVKKKYPKYNFLDGDMIGLGYQRAIVEKAYKEMEGPTLKFSIDSEFNLLVAMKVFEANAENYSNMGIIFQSDFLSLEYAKEYLNKDNIVLVFGYPNATIDQVINNLNLDENVFDIKEKKKLASTYIDISKHVLGDCKKLGLKFVDTSHHREKVFKELLEFISKEI